MRKLMLFLVTLLLTACVPVTQVTPTFDALPVAPAQTLTCDMVGTGDGFTLACVSPPTPAPAPAFWYFWCDGDPRCAAGQFRVYWDRDLTMLRCALTQGEKVTRIADGYSMRPGEGEELAWVVTGTPAGVDRVCEGWVPVTFLRAAE